MFPFPIPAFLPFLSSLWPCFQFVFAFVFVFFCCFSVLFLVIPFFYSLFFYVIFLYSLYFKFFLFIFSLLPFFFILSLRLLPLSAIVNTNDLLVELTVGRSIQIKNKQAKITNHANCYIVSNIEVIAHSQWSSDEYNDAIWKKTLIKSHVDLDWWVLWNMRLGAYSVNKENKAKLTY